MLLTSYFMLLDMKLSRWSKRKVKGYPNVGPSAKSLSIFERYAKIVARANDKWIKWNRVI